MANTAVVYSRSYAGKDLRFEPSGGLLHSALVMQDQQTDTYWSIMTGDAIGGKMKGTPLRELPVGAKARWGDWVKRHPDTLVLSVNGEEDESSNPYEQYFRSDKGFGNAKARDKRLRTKTPVYTFRIGKKTYAVPFRAIEGGAAFKLKETTVFLYRPKNVPMFHSTAAFQALGGEFKKRDGVWYYTQSGGRFDARSQRFEGGDSAQPRPLKGFDTFWYTWSLTNPQTEILGR